MFRLAHVTDPHFRPPRGFQGVRAGELWGKRAVGYANLVINRVRKHKMELLEDMRVDLPADTDPEQLALATLAALQGGLLMTQLERDTRPLEAALDAMLDRIQSLADAKTPA